MKVKGSINVLSLFDGMSCGRVALDRAGISVGKYYASEIDIPAIFVSQNNWPDIEHIGDVTKWREWYIDWSGIDLLIGGSPCQGFSFAGKQLAFDDPRSKLFFVYVDILNHIKSVNHNVKFMLENVRMKKEYLEIISDHLGVKPAFINSALVSAQNRQRYYWANWDFEQPEDKGILLSDIVEKKTNCLTTVQKDNVIAFAENYVQYDKSGKGHKSQDQRAYYLDAKMGSLTAHRTDSKTNTLFGEDKEKIYYRKLTPIECERLQTAPDNYTNHVSNTQRYKMLGNGWTVDVITHLFKGLPYD